MEADVQMSSAPTPEKSARMSAARSRDIGWIEYLGLSGIVKIGLLAAVLYWFYLDHLKRMVKVWQQPDWSHGYLVPVFALYLVHQNRRALLDDRHEGSLAGLALMLMALLGYVVAVYAKIGYPQPLTIVFVIAGLVLLLRGWQTLKLVWFPLAFLFLAIPPPDRLYKEITQPLQWMAAFVAKYVLSIFPGVEDIQQAGFNIAYFMTGGRDGTFTVAGACSGMRSLMAFVAIGLAMAYLTPRPMWQRLFLAGCVVPVALFCNVARVIVTGSLQMYGRPNLATGTPHTILGLVMFAVGFLIYSGLIWTLDHLFVDDEESVAPSAGGAA